jgi:hypothetical protein
MEPLTGQQCGIGHRGLRTATPLRSAAAAAAAKKPERRHGRNALQRILRLISRRRFLLLLSCRRRCPLAHMPLLLLLLLQRRHRRHDGHVGTGRQVAAALLPRQAAGLGCARRHGSRFWIWPLERGWRGGRQRRRWAGPSSNGQRKLLCLKRRRKKF